ncbi:hypothetical protein Mal4_37880 [Maioricimonas rarisocia]|uniref:Uncharacterized protein n=1 Tax=Maioricimonas rarisocia TaxID=2528026 RepID=A0A517ZAC9_9PLAN|nr:hypothetical protein [Maioricimonas rarisocia]QDU39443.1 hypothetical protein Mal4_37880 [Maioricimonas rarisocia]
MSTPAPPQSLPARARRGATEGLAWGATIGLFRGFARLLAEDAAPWYLQVGGSLLAGAVIGVLICSIGRAIAGRLAGAFVGAILGLFAGLYVGSQLGPYEWTIIDETETTRTMIGVPVGQMIGTVVGLTIGAAAGALVDRMVRGRPVDTHSSPD